MTKFLKCNKQKSIGMFDLFTFERLYYYSDCFLFYESVTKLHYLIIIKILVNDSIEDNDSSLIMKISFGPTNELFLMI